MDELNYIIVFYIIKLRYSRVSYLIMSLYYYVILLCYLFSIVFIIPFIFSFLISY